MIASEILLKVVYKQPRLSVMNRQDLSRNIISPHQQHVDTSLSTRQQTSTWQQNHTVKQVSSRWNIKLKKARVVTQRCLKILMASINLHPVARLESL